MKRNIFKGLFPKMSILKKNKWLLLAIVVLVCLGLYFYSIKNKENFESKQILEDTSIKDDLFNDYNINMTDVIIEENEKLSDKFNLNLNLMNTIFVIKDNLIQSSATCKLTITDRGKNLNDNSIELMEVSEFKMNEKETFKLNCAGSSGEPAMTNLNKLFKKLDEDTKQLLIKNPDTEYVSGVRLENLNIYLATGCAHSDNFKNIQQSLSSKLSNSIVIKNIQCETHSGDIKTITTDQDVIAECKLGGYYKPTRRDNWDKPRVFPTIEYSSVIEISKAVDKATRGGNIVDPPVVIDKEEMVGKDVNIRLGDTTDTYAPFPIPARIDWYDPVTDRHLINYYGEKLEDGRLDLSEFKKLDLDGDSSWSLYEGTMDEMNQQTRVDDALKIPIGTIIEVFNEGSTEVLEYEVYWYDGKTGLYLIKIEDRWEYVSLYVLKWRIKTEVVGNYYYTNKFDPKKKLDTAKTSFVNEDDGKIEYSETKILDWLSTIRESKSNTNSNTKSSNK